MSGERKTCACGRVPIDADGNCATCVDGIIGSYNANDWASPQLFSLVVDAEEYADTLPPGSTERGLIREAIRKIELADTYIEKRLREEAA